VARGGSWAKAPRLVARPKVRVSTEGVETKYKGKLQVFGSGFRWTTFVAMERLGCHSVFSYVFLDVQFFFATFFPLKGEKFGEVFWDMDITHWLR